jgi:hypothetical protein
MPDITPKEFGDSYDIYPGKASSDGTELSAILDEVKSLVGAVGMTVSSSRGDSPKPEFRQS